MKPQKYKLIFVVVIMFISNIIMAQGKDKKYNESKDALVNSLLDMKCNKVKYQYVDFMNVIYYDFYYDNYKLSVTHYLQKDYEQKDSWDYDLYKKNGEMIIIHAPSRNQYGMISDITYRRIQKLCKSKYDRK